MNTKIKVLTVNCVNRQGSTGKIIGDVADILSTQCEFYHCFEQGEVSSDREYALASRNELRFYYALGRLTGLKYSTGYHTTWRLIRYIHRVQPDIVHLHCPNMNTVNIPWLIRWLKQHDYPIVFTNHAEFYYTGNCPHAYDCLKFQTGCGHCDYVFDPVRNYVLDRTHSEWKRMYRAFQGYHRIVGVAVSPWVLRRMELSPLMANIPKLVIENAVDTEHVFLYRGQSDHQRKIILHVTAGFSNLEKDLKGGRFVIELARSLPQYDVVVVGPCNITQETSLPNNMRCLGVVRDQMELSKLYSDADVTVITSKRETFSMICAESLCCGTPVVGFEAGGPESISIPEYSRFVPYGDVDALSGAVCEMIEQSMDKVTVSNAACLRFQRKRMAMQYLEVYRSILEDTGR